MDEKERSHWHALGLADGLYQASERLLQYSLDAFARGSDDYARLLRGHARHLKAKADEAWPLQEKELEE